MLQSDIVKEELVRISKAMSEDGTPHVFFVFDPAKDDYEYTAFLPDANDACTIMEALASDHGGDIKEGVCDGILEHLEWSDT